MSMAESDGGRVDVCGWSFDLAAKLRLSDMLKIQQNFTTPSPSVQTRPFDDEIHWRR